MYIDAKCLLLLCAIVFVVVVAKSDGTVKYMSGTIEEENGPHNVNLGVKKRDISAPNAAAEKTGKSSKFLSNKEVIPDDEDDEESSSSSASSSNGKAEALGNLLLLSRFQRTDSHHQQKNTRHKLAPSKNRLDDIDEESVLRDYLNSLRLSDEENNLFENDVSLWEDEMRLKELTKPEWSNYADDDDLAAAYKFYLSQNNNNNNNNNKNNNNKNHHKKPVKSVEVKEKLMLENDYNKQFKSSDRDSENPFFSPEQAGHLSPELFAETSQQQQQPIAINEIPSMINKQAQNSIDPSLSSKIESLKQQNDYLFTFVLAGCILAGVVALIAAGVCWYTVHKNYRANQAELGVKIGKFNSGGSTKSAGSSSSGDRRLAQSAQMYHYQHQKQQMIAMEKANNDTKPDNSDNSEGETEEGDYTVYECPGLAPTGEMEVKNPLFKEDFSQSLHNIQASQAAAAAAAAQPPAYATLTPSTPTVATEQLIQIDPPTPTSPAVAAETAPNSETSASMATHDVAKQQQSASTAINLASEHQTEKN